jgi:hypothetical protein
MTGHEQDNAVRGAVSEIVSGRGHVLRTRRTGQLTGTNGGREGAAGNRPTGPMPSGQDNRTGQGGLYRVSSCPVLLDVPGYQAPVSSVAKGVVR